MPIVIKYGGSAMTDAQVRAGVAARIARVPQAIVVHGGGPFIAEALADAGLESRFVRGLRVTNAESLGVIERTLTQLSKLLAQEVGSAVGLSGRDSSLLVATPLGAELGFVGEVTSVNRRLLEGLLSLGVVPVIACLAETEDRRGVLNVNADSAAGAVAGALGAPVVFLSDVPGVLDHPQHPEVLLELGERSIYERIRDGRITGGMIPKVEAALQALRAGASFAVIADGRAPERLEAALAGESGTRIVR